MKRMLKKFLLIATFAIILCGSVIATHAFDCKIKCPVCGGENVNHYHPCMIHEDAYRAICRDCNYEWANIEDTCNDPK